MQQDKLMTLLLVTLAFFAPQFAGAATFEELFPDLADAEVEGVETLKTFDYQQGQIELSAAGASLNVPESFYYLSPIDAQKVLVQLWGNPKSDNGLGMLFPRNITPLHEGSWGVEITWDDIGYVSDEDAHNIDFAELLGTMQQEMQQQNEARKEAGYDTVELLGWAAQPHYDAGARKLHWAKELRFGAMESSTLNYNIRALGRKGVLQLNFIADMAQLDEVVAAAPEVIAMSSFSEGSRYQDFVPGADTVAAVGIGGLIAGKALAKAGLLAAALVFLKKFWFILIVPLLWLWRRATGGSKQSNSPEAQ